MPNPELPPFRKTSNPPAAGDVALACRGIGKRLGGLVAVADAELEIRARRLQALIGRTAPGRPRCSTWFRACIRPMPTRSGRAASGRWWRSPALAGKVRLLLDEPFENPAPALTGEIFKTLDALRGEVPILISKHLDLVLAPADRA